MDSIKHEYNALNKPSYEERIVMVTFFLVSIAWIFRKDINIGDVIIPGWSSTFSFYEYIDDATVIIFAIILLFIIPSKSNPETHILQKKEINNLPWHIVLFFGGGFALASGMMSSGLSEYIGNQFTQFSDINYFSFLLILAIVVSLLTEITSNLASSQMLLPILASVSISMGLDPIPVLFVATVAASLAFMLPVATPPNTIVFSTNKIRIIDMMRSGVLLNFFGAFLLTFVVYFFMEF